MAPEQVRGETLDARADLFALGSVLYAMTCGHPPFRASTTFAVLQRVANDVPRPLHELIPETPEWLCRTIAKLHEKNPDDRYASAKAVADDLRRQSAPNQPSRAKAGGVPLPYAIGIGLAVAIVVLGSVIVATWKPKSSTPAISTTVPTVTTTTSLSDWLTSPNGSWAEPVNLGPTINTNSREVSASLTDDECTIIFVRDTKLMIARRANRDDAFGDVIPLSDSINNAIREGASVSGDGTVLVFPSKRTGAFHLWMATRPDGRAEFGMPIELPGPVNGDGNDVAACLTSDALALYHNTYRTGIQDKGDIVSTSRPDRAADFARFQRHAPPLNSSSFDVCDWVSRDELTMISTRMPDGLPTVTRV
jgi:hypothetical protein